MYTQLTREQRYAIYLGKQDGMSQSAIARQIGAIENTNKLIRQYIPKGTDFNDITDEYIHSVQLRLNRRPRQKLNFLTPKDVFFNLLL